jgi:tRNA threonylcarbamoyladenosine biosynthesis protein TsaE
MSRETTLATAEDTRRWGKRLAQVLAAGDLVVLTGGLGAGKTTLTQGLAEGLGVRGPITSPTFVIARVHRDGRVPLVHVDAYRLGSPAEVDDLDLDFAGSVVVVEWGRGMLEGVAESQLEVLLERPSRPTGHDPAVEADEPRTVVLQGVGPRWAGSGWAALP